MRFSRKAQWIALVFAALAVVAILYFNLRSAQVRSDLAALHAMGASTTPQELKAMTHRIDARATPEFDALVQNHPKIFASANKFVFRNGDISTLLWYGRSDAKFLQDFVDTKGCSTSAILNDSNFDARIYLSEFVLNDLDRIQHPDMYLHFIDDPTTGSLRSFKDRTVYPKRIASAAAKDLHLWRIIYERFPKGKVDPITAYRTINNAINEYDPRLPEEDALAFASETRRGFNRANSWLIRMAKMRQVRVLARLNLDYLKTHKIATALPDYGVDSTSPFTGEQFGYRVKPGYQTSQQLTVYSSGLGVASEISLP
jgi:hypothetical protein